MKQKPNKLINEKSPYLLQHAYNPVDWYPWCEEAFEKAKREDKPVFLSIGYSTCHWCHVMEKESFEDEKIAKLLNDSFVSIKVDREERPDIDGVYMSVCQMITGSGGWPLTIIMTPDKKPFFAGTYFPKHNLYGRIGMTDLLPKLADIWKKRRHEVIKSAEEITAALNRLNVSKENDSIDNSIFDKAFDEYSKRFDTEHGGFGNAPKFPTPHNLLFLLRYYKRTKNLSALKMVEKTLTEMRKGGIYDHIGFGFARYSTDKYWLVPHFEKMLYDNALLIMAFTECYQITQNKFYKSTAEEIITYILRDMTHPEGGFYSAEDADSEGEEGKFYLWTEVEIRQLLSEEEADFIMKVFNVETIGNWYDEARGVRTGNNILHLKKTYKELAEEYSLTEEEFVLRFEAIKKKMFLYREKRVHPYKDDKILTDWNSLMISALVKSSLAFDKKALLEDALRADSFIKKYLYQNGKLFHRFREGESAIDGTMDDYSFYIQAQLDLFEATAEAKFLETAINLNKYLYKKFRDEKNHGYFFTSEDSEKLLTRQKEIYDGAVPSGNSVHLLNLIRLYNLTGDNFYREEAYKQINAFAGEVKRMPSVFAQFLCGLDFLFGPSIELIISAKESKVTDQVNRKISQIYYPSKVIIQINESNKNDLSKLIQYAKDYQISEDPKLYLCRNFICEQPTSDVNGVVEKIKEF